MDRYEEFLESLESSNGDPILTRLAAEYVLSHPNSGLFGEVFDQLTDDLRELYQKLIDKQPEDDWAHIEEAVVAVGDTKMSTKPWGKVKKSDLPASAFLIVGDRDVESTWHLPYRDETGNISMEAVRAISGVIAGARGGAKFTIPDSIREKVQGWVEQIKKWTDEKSGQEAETVSGGANAGEEIYETIPCPANVQILEAPGKFRVDVTVIQKGWSKNGRYYDDHALEQMTRMIAGDQWNRKVYLNHNMGRPVDRDIRDWAAQVVEVRYEDGKVIATWEVFEEPDGKFLKERIQKFPDAVGISIDARANMKRGEAEGIKGSIVTDVVWFSSMDVVTRPAAGGGVNQIAEAWLLEDDKMERESIADMLKGNDIRDKYWKLSSALDEALRLIYRNEKIKDKDKKTKVKKALTEFSAEVERLDLKLAFGDRKYEAEQNTEDEQVSEEVKENMNEIKTVEELIQKLPNLTEEFKKQILADVDRDTEFKALQKENEGLKEASEKRDEEFKALSDKNEELQASLESVERKALVEKKLSNPDLPEDAVDDQLKESLLEAEDEDAIDKLIEARKELVEKLRESVAKTNKTSGLGPSPKPKGKPTSSEKTKVTIEQVLEKAGYSK